MNKTTVLVTLAGQEQTSVIVAQIASGYSVTVRDDESEEFLPFNLIFSTVELALGKAQAIATGKDT